MSVILFSVSKKISNQNKNIAILLCAGSSERVKSFDKSIVDLNGNPIFYYSLEKLVNSKKIEDVIIVASKNNVRYIEEYVNDNNYKKVQIIEGSSERKYSVKNALDYISNQNPLNVIIHDSARPYFDEKNINNGLEVLNRFQCAVPLLKVVDTIKKINKDNVLSTVDRDKLYYSKTPQFFNFNKLYDLVLKNVDNKVYTDEIQLFEEYNIEVGIFDGNLNNHKITYENDLNELKNINIPLNFTGISADVHKLSLGEKLYLGGVQIPYEKGLLGHSDGDVVIHAICDAILGAAGKGDLGKYYPSSDNKWKGASSKLFLTETLDILEKEKKEIKNIDIQIILQEPKLFEYINIIEENICKLLKINQENINVKVTSTDGLGLIGSSNGIATLCAVNIIKK